MRDFLPVTREDCEKRGWGQLDFVYVIGDAYVDHPSFGPAIISRLLEAHGFSVGIIPQPDWRNDKSIQVFGEPRLGFLVSGGNMDSMVNHYSVSKKRRVRDMYSPGGEMGRRPDYAVVVYGNLIRRTYKHTPMIIGGIEASLRRLAHYDYWSNKIRRSVLLDSGADLISYGMGERSIVAIAEALDSGLSVEDITFIDGTVYKTRDYSLPEQNHAQRLPDFESVRVSRRTYAESFYIQYQNTDHVTANVLYETYDEKLFVVQNRPSKPLTQEEMDRVYALPYMRTCHPMYEAAGGIPAISEVKFSLISSRGCFGGCNFCALTFHQGRTIQTRSHASILEEAKLLTYEPDFKGYIHDVGGPTANFRHPSCEKQLEKGVCANRQCLFPAPCKNLKVDHRDYLALLRKLRELPGVKKVFIRSGIRFDYVLADSNDQFLRELCEHHISGQLKVAPEHISRAVLDRLGKPAPEVYKEFVKRYTRMNEQLGKKQYLVPYLMSSHPGATLKEAIELAEYLRDIRYTPKQVQDFYPTPSTISTCMYYTGLDPRDMSEVYTAVNPHEKAMQRALMQFGNPKNYDLVREALMKAGRTDLIGFDKKCLIRPRPGEGIPGGKKSAQKGKTDHTDACARKHTSGQNENGRKRKKKTIRNIHKKK